MSFLKGIAIFFTGLACLAGSMSAAAEETVAGSDRSMVIGYSSTVFFSVDPRDAVGLTKVWLQTVDRAVKNPVPSNVVFFRNIEELEKALKEKRVDIAVMIAQEFVLLRDHLPLAAVLSADYGKHFYDELLLLVRNDSGITRVEQLRGKSIRIESGQKGSLPVLWLDSYLMKRVASGSRGFFSTIGEYPKASQVVMPLFFGQTDACLSSRDSLEIMDEMNPQVGRSLRILETSPGFVTGVIAVRRDIRNPRRDAMLKAMREIHNDPKGRQLLTLFRINRLVDFKAEHLLSIDRVLKEYRERVETVSRRRR